MGVSRNAMVSNLSVDLVRDFPEMMNVNMATDLPVLVCFKKTLRAYKLDSKI